MRKGTNTVIATINLATVGTTKKYIMSSPTDVPRLVNKSPAEQRLEPQLKRALFATLESRDARLNRQRKKEPAGPGDLNLKIKTDSIYDIIDPSSKVKIEIKVERIAPLNSPESEKINVFKMVEGEWEKISRKSNLYTYIMDNISIPDTIDLNEYSRDSPLLDVPVFDFGIRPES